MVEDRTWTLYFLLLGIFCFVPVSSHDADTDCAKPNPFLPWVLEQGSKRGHLPLRYRDTPGHWETSGTSTESDLSFFTCVKTDGVEPPQDLTSFSTSLLHEHDVTHHLTWTGQFWLLGSGAYADVHLGRLGPRGECVVVKQFVGSPLATIEREIRMHRYIEHILPSTPRLLGLLPSGRDLRNASLVYQLVPDSSTLYDWLHLSRGLSLVQWLSVALQLAEALEILHRKCVLHNDLHSSNVLLHFPRERRDIADCRISRLEKRKDDSRARLYRSLAKVKDTTLPRVTLIDFGHATFRQGRVYQGSETSLASCRHLAPEVARHVATSPSTDVYSLGQELLHIADLLNSSSMLDVALQCAETSPEARPPVSEVVHRLKGQFLNEYRRHRSQRRIALEANWFRDWSGSGLSPETPSSFDQLFGNLITGAFSRAVHEETPQCSERRSSHPVRDELKTRSGGSHLKSCCPEVLENAMSEITLPYVPYAGDLINETVMEKKVTLFDSHHTAIYIGQFLSTGEHVIVKRLKSNRNYFTIRYEAMVNAILNETGWVPRFYGVIPLNNHDLDLGIVQELFAEGRTLEEILKSGKPVGITARVDLAYHLTSLVHDLHSRHILINNFKSDNVLCACVDDTSCSEIKLIDLGEVTGCEGKRYDFRETYLRHFRYMAPEVRRNQMTSFQSDVFSLCVLLDSVLDRAVMTEGGDKDDVGEGHYWETWTSLSGLCASHLPHLRPSAFQLKHFFSGFLKFVRHDRV